MLKNRNKCFWPQHIELPSYPKHIQKWRNIKMSQNIQLLSNYYIDVERSINIVAVTSLVWVTWYTGVNFLLTAKHCKRDKLRNSVTNFWASITTILLDISNMELLLFTNHYHCWVWCMFDVNVFLSFLADRFWFSCRRFAACADQRDDQLEL